MYVGQQSAFLRAFRKLDMYPRIDADATHATCFGFLLTMAGIIISITLFVGQWTEFFHPKLQTEFFVVGQNRTAASLGRNSRAQMYVDFNVTFDKMPCNYLTVDYYDVFGDRDLDISNHINLNSAGNGQESFASSTVTGSGRKLLHASESVYGVEGSDRKGPRRKVLSVEDDDASNSKDNDDAKSASSEKEGAETEKKKPSGKDPNDPFDVIPDDVPIIRLNDLEALAKTRGEESDLHPSAIVIRVGDQERHVIPGGGEHQVISEDNPVHDATEGGSTLLTPSTFNDFVKKHDVVLVNFFVPWCHWCQRFSPVWEAASKTLHANTEDFSKTARLAKVNCDEKANTELCRTHQIRGFPTVKVFRAGSSKTHKQYAGDRTVSSIIDYIRKLPKVPDPMTQYGPETVKREETDQCKAWRQTADCDPNGKREPDHDKGCKQKIDRGSSGYCECAEQVHASPVKCEHGSFTCERACREKLAELASEPERKKDAQLVAKMRLHGMKNIVGMHPMAAHIHKAQAMKKFAAMHEDDVRSHEPEREHLELGCTVTGSFKVGLIPGSLVFTAYSPWHNFNREAVDMSHKVDKLVFGQQNKGYRKHELRSALEGMESNGYHVNSLAGRSFDVPSDGHKFAHEHYLRLMQTEVERRAMNRLVKSKSPFSRNVFPAFREKFFLAFQYAMNSHRYELDPEADELPSVRFVWDMDSVGIEISKERKSIYSLVTSLLAIIGGTFTVFSVADGAFFSIWKRFLGGRRRDLKRAAT